MSKYVKYISSKHYGAPEMKGDRYGYLVEMLRTVLCTGFNERTDVSKITVLTNNTFKVEFLSEHNYVVNQTIKIKDFYIPELTEDSLVVSTEQLSIICESYVDLTGIIDQIYDNLVDVKSIVAPLGFIEKFKDGNRSAFTTDEEEAYLYIDDETPSNWNPSATNTTIIIPIVAMTDKMTDIDNFGRYIVPYDSNNPDRFKTKGYKDGTFERNGLWNWITYGVHTTNGNNTTQRQIKLEYTVIGNGRLFYFLPKLIYQTNKFTHIYAFGKINNENKQDDILNILCANSGRVDNTSYAHSRLNGNSAMPFSNVEQQEYGLATDLGNISHAILKIGIKSFNVRFTPTLNDSSTTVNISGVSSSFQYPDQYTKKYYTSKIYAFGYNGLYGKLSGMQWVYNPPSEIFVNDGKIMKFKNNNRTKNMYFIRGLFSTIKNNSLISANSKYVYNISLDYKDWYNYD